jgi:hypothetical protein
MVQKGQGVPAFWFARAIEYGSQEALYEPYKDSAWVRRAVKHVAGPIAGVELVFTNPSVRIKNNSKRRRLAKRVFTSRGILRRDPDAEIELPQVREFLRSPMRGLTYEDFVEASIGWMKLSECFWILDDRALVPFPDVAKNPFPQIVVARPDRMRHIVENGMLIGWEFRDGQGKSVKLLPEQVIRLYGWNPYNDWRGLGDYPSANVAAESDWLAGKFTRNLMGNNGDTGPLIVAKTGVPTDPQREQIIMALKEKRAAQLRGEFRPTFLTGDISVEDPAIKSPDATFVAQRLENRHEIYIAFGVPPSLADVKAAYSIGSASDFYQLILNTCIPEGKKFCAAIETLVQKITGQSVEVGLDWDEHPVMQEVRKERLDAADKLWSKGVPMKEIDEYLGLDLPDYDGKEIGYLPINVMPATEINSPDSEALDLSEQTPQTMEQPAAVKNMLALLKRGPTVEQCSDRDKKLWEAHMRLRSKAMRLYQSKCSKVFNDFRARALQRVSVAMTGKSVETKSLIDLIFDPKDFGATLVKHLDPIARTVLQAAGDELFEEIGRADDPWQMPPHDVTKFIASRETFIKGVGDTARSQINTAVQEGVDKGEGVEEISDRIRGAFNNLSKYESRRIATTEVSAAYGFSRHKAMADAGVQYKTWLSSHGPNVRPAHAKAELDYGPESAIPVDEPFVVDGEELMHPGDPSGSAGNIINCQCIELAAMPPKEENQ